MQINATSSNFCNLTLDRFLAPFFFIFMVRKESFLFVIKEMLNKKVPTGLLSVYVVTYWAY